MKILNNIEFLQSIGIDFLSAFTVSGIFNVTQVFCLFEICCDIMWFHNNNLKRYCKAQRFLRSWIRKCSQKFSLICLNPEPRTVSTVVMHHFHIVWFMKWALLIILLSFRDTLCHLYLRIYSIGNNNAKEGSWFAI